MCSRLQIFSSLTNFVSCTAKQYQSLHLPWGVPSGGEGGGACLLSQEEYIVQYSTTLHVPLWLAYRLTAEVRPGSGWRHRY